MSNRFDEQEQKLQKLIAALTMKGSYKLADRVLTLVRQFKEVEEQKADLLAQVAALKVQEAKLTGELEPLVEQGLLALGSKPAVVSAVPVLQVTPPVKPHLSLGDLIAPNFKFSAGKVYVTTLASTLKDRKWVEYVLSQRRNPPTTESIGSHAVKAAEQAAERGFGKSLFKRRGIHAMVNSFGGRIYTALNALGLLGDQIPTLTHPVLQEFVDALLKPQDQALWIMFLMIVGGQKASVWQESAGVAQPRKKDEWRMVFQRMLDPSQPWQPRHNGPVPSLPTGQTRALARFLAGPNPGFPRGQVSEDLGSYANHLEMSTRELTRSMAALVEFAESLCIWFDCVTHLPRLKAEIAQTWFLSSWSLEQDEFWIPFFRVFGGISSEHFKQCADPRESCPEPHIATSCEVDETHMAIPSGVYGH